MSNLKKEKEKNLVTEFKKGNQEAFHELYFRYKDRTFQILLKYLKNRDIALDLLQDTFMKIFTYREEIKLNQDFYKLLVSIAINAAIDYLRKEKKNKIISLDTLLSEHGKIFSDKDQNTAKKIEKKMTQLDLETALNLCADKERRAIILKIYGEMTHDEVAATLNISPRSSKRYIKGGLEKIGVLLEKKGYKTNTGRIQ